MNEILLIIQKLSAPVIIFGGTAWIVVEKSFTEGFGYLLITAFIYFVLMFIESRIEKELLPERYRWDRR